MDTSAVLASTMSVGLLVLRLVLGFYMAAHGTQKRFGWFGGHGLAGTGGLFEQLGFRPERTFATVASATEVVGEESRSSQISTVSSASSLTCFDTFSKRRSTLARSSSVTGRLRPLTSIRMGRVSSARGVSDHDESTGR